MVGSRGLGYAGALCESGLDFWIFGYLGIPADLGLGSGQHVLPHAIRLVIGPDLGHIQCRSVHADRHGVRVLELAPVPYDGLRAGIYGEATHRQHRCGSIYGKHYIAVASHAEHAPQIGLLDGGCRLTLAMGRYQASSVR